jgi:MFS family permease
MWPYLIGGVIGGIITAAVADHRGRNAWGWFFYGFAFGFIVPLIVLFCLPKKQIPVEEETRI